MTFQERNSHIGVTPNDGEPSNERSLGRSNGDNQGEIPKERPEHTTFHFKVDVFGSGLDVTAGPWLTSWRSYPIWDLYMSRRPWQNYFTHPSSERMSYTSLI